MNNHLLRSLKTFSTLFISPLFAVVAVPQAANAVPAGTGSPLVEHRILGFRQRKSGLCRHLADDHGSKGRSSAHGDLSRW